MQGLGPIALPLAVLLVAAAAHAGEGRVEISQASILAAGGYPLVLTQPGSYVLTGNLEVPEGESGIAIATSDVTLDLNGFRIWGGPGCDPDEGSGCPEEAIITSGGQTGHRVTLRNGIIRGFNSTCVSLGDRAQVREIDVSGCRTGDGILVGAGALVVQNRVSNTGENGIRMLDSSSTYSHNVVTSAGQGGPGRAIVGGRPSAGNSCDDGSCSSDGRRRYYLTTAYFDGSTADEAGTCAAGFHFASIWEIRDPTVLHYDRSRGPGPPGWDLGEGPPVLYGWVRTGFAPNGGGVAGLSNCDGWTTNAGAELGSLAGLAQWNDPAGSAAPWRAALSECVFAQQVWCIED